MRTLSLLILVAYTYSYTRSSYNPPQKSVEINQLSREQTLKNEFRFFSGVAEKESADRFPIRLFTGYFPYGANKKKRRFMPPKKNTRRNKFPGIIPNPFRSTWKNFNLN